MDKLTIAIAQLNLLVGDIEYNADRVIENAERAKTEFNADIVIFSELTLTSYPPEDLLFRPMLYKRVHQALDKICGNIKNIAAVVGYPNNHDDKYYNQAAVIENGKIVATHTKEILPNYTVFDEKRYFSPGHQPTIFEIKGIKIGLLICEDIWAEDPIKKVVENGAQLIIVINASPFAIDKSYVRRNLLQKRSKKFNVPIVYANLVGGQDELVFDGGSMVYDHQGQLCQQAKYFQEDFLKIEFDLNLNILTKHILPAEPLDEEKVYQALVLGVRDYIEKNHFPGAVLGLSGGIDSALTLAIACDAIGSHRVEAIMMPSRYTADMSIEDAKAEAILLNAKYSIIEIEKPFSAFLTVLADEFKDYKKDTTEENLQARCRGTILMAISNKKGSIVLTTGNKSEMAVGYATLYGDMAGGFCVLKDVYKTMVYRLARYRNTISAVIPERVITRPPTAELAPDQLDQDSLPPYPILDEILEKFVAQDQDAYTIAKAGFDLEVVKKVVRMVIRNEYKRRQAPPGIRITGRAFGKDRRYPITNAYFKHYFAR